MIHGTEAPSRRSICLVTLSSGMQRMASQPLARRVAAVAILCGALVACSPRSSTAAPPPSQSSPPAVAGAALPAAAAAAPMVQGLPDFSALVERYGPAVVNVDVVSRRESRGQKHPIRDNPRGPGDRLKAGREWRRVSAQEKVRAPGTGNLFARPKTHGN